MPYTKDYDVRLVNESVINALRSDDPLMRKEAQENTSDYLRIRLREDGFTRRFFNPANITPADLDRQVDTQKPVIVRDMEPNSAGAYSLPFGTTPMDNYIRAPRYRVMFDRIESRRYYADVNDLLTYEMDIRQILNDFILKDIMAEEDRKFMLVVDTTVGTVNTVNPILGSCQYITVGAMNRQSIAHAMKGLPSTNRHLNPAKALVNNITVWDVVAQPREQIGGSLAEELFVDGFAERKIMGLNWAITIKTDLVADSSAYMFAEPKFLGDFFILDDVTMSSKNEDYMLSFFAYECVGGTIMNTAAVAKVDFSGDQKDWRTGL
jgi:hypothetical protein